METVTLNFPQTILFLYMIIASNYTKHLYSGQLEDFIKENKFAQHLIGILFIFVLLSFISANIDITKTTIYSLLIYLWFVVSTKLDIQWSIIIILLLLTNYGYELYLKNQYKDVKDDVYLSDDMKDKILSRYENGKKIVTLLILGFTGVGTLTYMLKKNNQYGNDFNFNKFIFG